MSKNALETFEVLQPSKYTEPLLFIPGEYRLSQVGQVPYLSAVMPLQDLVEKIKLVEDIPGNIRFDWSLEELFQRDINWGRVETELVNGYLKDPNKVSFFNALTIALLPQKGGVITESYGHPEASPPASYPTWDPIDVGNIHLEYGADKSIGVIRWHKERVFPVAIDGQHRLAALKEYWKELQENSNASPPDVRTKIPIILLILDERAGFKGRAENTPIQALREIFIDLNKNARSVPKSRLILLEDLNIQSICTRTLLANKVTESAGALPLSMVTWREDEAKFDSGYSLTSVLNLNEIVNYCWGGTALEASDLLDELRGKNYVREITGTLQLEKKIADSINAHQQLCTEHGEPFNFTEKHLTAIQSAFRQQWTPHIVRVFSEFAPYKKYLSKAQDIGAIDGMLRDYLLLPKEQRQKFRNRKTVENTPFNPRTQLDAPLAQLEGLKTNKWAFYIGFQKALFLNLFELEKRRQSLFGGKPGRSREEFLTWWLAQMNMLCERGVFNLDWKKGKGDLWRGIAKNPLSGTIQYSKAAVNRINSFMTLCIWFKREPEQSDANLFATRLIEDTYGTLPNPIRFAFKKRVEPGLQALIRAKMDDDVEDKKLERMVKRELVKRFKAI